MAAVQQIYDDAHVYGARLAELLANSGLSEEVQRAWATLVPRMSVAQLQHFETLLRAHVNGLVQHELEDVFLHIKAEQTKHDLATAGVHHAAHTALDDLERQLDALERAGGKRDA